MVLLKNGFSALLLLDATLWVWSQQGIELGMKFLTTKSGTVIPFCCALAAGYDLRENLILGPTFGLLLNMNSASFSPLS